MHAERGRITSPFHAVVVFAAGYALWQPTAFLLLHLINGERWPSLPRHEWLAFEGTVALLGALAGIAWFFSRRLPKRSWKRAWADGGISMLALDAVVAAKEFEGMSAPLWIALVLLTASLTGVLFGSVANFVARSIAASNPVEPDRSL